MPHVLITGATDGIGLETARQLLTEGYTVVVHGRTEARATSAADGLRERHGEASPIPVWGDLSRMQEVITLAAQVRVAVPSLDALINNAGVYVNQRALTEDGFETTFAVNHFAHHLLTRLLVPLLEVAPAARIVVVSSGTHHSGKIDLDDLTGNVGWTPYGAYSNSKLANVLFMRALAKRLARPSITANALHPGVIGTKLLRAGFGSGGVPTSQGARTSVFLASDSAPAKISGKYFVDSRETPPARVAQDEKTGEGLWAETERLLKPYLG